MKARLLIAAAVIVVIGAGVTVYQRYLQGAWTAFGSNDRATQDLLARIPTQTQSTTTPSNDQRPELVTASSSAFAMLPGMSVGIFAENLKAPRDLVFDPNGVLIASIPSQGKVVALPDQDQNGKADKTETLVEGLNQPHGLVFDCSRGSCFLYVAETSRVIRFAYDSDTHKLSDRTALFDLPSGAGHSTRSLFITQTNEGRKLLTSIGSSCNVCEEKDPRRATVLISDLDGKNLRTYAKGLRNAVFFAEHPVTKQVWVTEMGRDLLGDDIPPDEINILSDGGDYGWPYCYGRNIHDNDFDPSKRVDCTNKQASTVDLQAHSAPLGLAFAPIDWAHVGGELIVAYHGSWNRSVPTGYKLVSISFDEKNQPVIHDLVKGWLEDRVAAGRPVDVLPGDKGQLFVSDDRAGVVYRFMMP